MATSLFELLPVGGTGTTQVSVSPLNSGNYNSYDWTTVGSISDGNTTKYFTITQFGVPAITQFGGSSNVPATGGTLMYTIYSHYPVVFRSVPDWVSIRDSHSNTYQEGQQIPSANTVNTTFFIDVAANTGSARSVGSTFNMGHYLRGSLAQRVDYITISQAAYVSGGTHTITSPSRLEIGKEGGSAKIIVTSDDYWYFYAVPSYITIYDENWNQQSSTSRHEGTGAEQVFYWVWPEYNGNEDRDAAAIMMWGPNMELVTGPVFTQHPYTVLPYVQGNSSYNVPATGGTVYTYVDSNLPWWWYQNKQVWDGTTNFPSWITVRNSNGIIMSGLTSNAKNTFKGGEMYSFTFAANTGTSRNFTPAIYYDRDSNTVSSATQSYAFVQGGSSSGSSSGLYFTILSCTPTPQPYDDENNTNHIWLQFQGTSSSTVNFTLTTPDNWWFDTGYTVWSASTWQYNGEPIDRSSLPGRSLTSWPAGTYNFTVGLVGIFDDAHGSGGNMFINVFLNSQTGICGMLRIQNTQLYVYPPVVIPNRAEFAHNATSGSSVDDFYITSLYNWNSTPFTSAVTGYVGTFYLNPYSGTAGTNIPVKVVMSDTTPDNILAEGGIVVYNDYGNAYISCLKGRVPTINGSSGDTSTQVIAGGSSTVTFNFHTDFDKTEIQFYAYGSWPTGITVTSDLGTYTDLGSGTYIGILETEWERDGYFSVNIPINVTGGQRRIVGIVYYYPSTNEDAHYSGPTFTIWQDD